MDSKIKTPTRQYSPPQFKIMSKLDLQFKNTLDLILSYGYSKDDRTGTGTISYPGVMIRHDMSEGFPLLTLRKVPFKSAAVELEGFIKGITSKKWYKDRGCNYWNQWCAPYKVAYGHDSDTKRKMEEEDDLGPIYGKQGREFSHWMVSPRMYSDLPTTLGRPGPKVDQLKNLVDELKTNPDSRRMVVSYWNPLCNNLMALMPCHTHWQVNVTDGRLNLFYYMRSVDFILGNNISSYGLLLHLLAKESGLKEGTLVGFFADAHVYTNQIAGAKEIITRWCDTQLPTVKTDSFKSIFEWEYKDTELFGYNPQDAIKFEVAI